MVESTFAVYLLLLPALITYCLMGLGLYGGCAWLMERDLIPFCRDDFGPGEDGGSFWFWTLAWPIAFTGWLIGFALVLLSMLLVVTFVIYPKNLLKRRGT